MANADHPLLVSLGKVLRAHREAAGLTQEAVSVTAGRHPKYLGPIERGERNVGILTLQPYAEALGLELSELIREAEEGLR